MVTYGADGPIRSKSPLLANKDLFGDGRYIREEINGEFGGARHQKLTLLGFNNTRGRMSRRTIMTQCCCCTSLGPMPRTTAR